MCGGLKVLGLKVWGCGVLEVWGFKQMKAGKAGKAAVKEQEMWTRTCRARLVFIALRLTALAADMLVGEVNELHLVRRNGSDRRNRSCNCDHRAAASVAAAGRDTRISVFWWPDHDERTATSRLVFVGIITVNKCYVRSYIWIRTRKHTGMRGIHSRS